jgi:hypothetical protein
MTKVELYEGRASVSFDDKAKGPTDITINADTDRMGKRVYRELSAGLTSRGHLIDMEGDFPGNIQMALNDVFGTDLEITGVITPEAPEGAVE